MGLLRVGQDGLQLLLWQTRQQRSRAARSPQSRVTSSVGSVGKSKNTVCLLIENDEQIAIACVGMADVNNPIILGISGEVLYFSLPKA